MKPTFLEKSIYNLLQSEPYYAYFILESRIMYDVYNVQTAGACVIKGSTTLIFNTKWMNSLTEQETVAVLKHEILHLLMVHDLRKNNKYTAEANNIAMDCAINQYITDLPKGGVTLELMSEVCKTTLEAFQTTEYYLSKLPKNNSEASKLKTTDDHDLDIPEQEKNTEIIKAVTKSISEKSLSRAAGLVPNKLDSILGKLQENKLDWKGILRNFIVRNNTSKTNITRKKIHRRFELDQPGRKKRKELKLGICMDVSGSVSNEHVQEFYNEVGAMIPSISELWLVQADCDVHSSTKITKKSQLIVKRTGNGGTAYNSAIKECVNKKCDAIIYFGDMDCGDTPDNPQLPFLWVSVGSDNKPGNFGTLIKL